MTQRALSGANFATMTGAGYGPVAGSVALEGARIAWVATDLPPESDDWPEEPQAVRLITPGPADCKRIAPGQRADMAIRDVREAAEPTGRIGFNARHGRICGGRR